MHFHLWSDSSSLYSKNSLTTSYRSSNTHYQHPGGSLDPPNQTPKLLDNWSRITKQTIYYQLNQTFPRARNVRKPIPGLKKCPTRPHQAGATPLEPHEEARTPRTLPGQGEFSMRHTQYKPRYKPITKDYKRALNAGNSRTNSQSSTRTGRVTKSTTHSSPNVDRLDSPFTRRAPMQHIHS